MLVVISVFILAVSILILNIKEEKYIKELRKSNLLELRIENEDLKFDASKYKRIIKEIEKVIFMNNYNNKEFQMRKIKELVLKVK